LRRRQKKKRKMTLYAFCTHPTYFFFFVLRTIYTMTISMTEPHHTSAPSPVTSAFVKLVGDDQLSMDYRTEDHHSDPAVVVQTFHYITGKYPMAPPSVAGAAAEAVDVGAGAVADAGAGAVEERTLDEEEKPPVEPKPPWPRSVASRSYRRKREIRTGNQGCGMSNFSFLRNERVGKEANGREEEEKEEEKEQSKKDVRRPP
jgi:hypothetical protein